MESTCQRGTLVLPLFSLCLFFLAGLGLSHADHGEDYYATCILQPLGFAGLNISGIIKLHESGGSPHITTLIGNLTGFTNGTVKRGFHVHENGSTDGNCSAAEGHYNPFNQNHGAPNDTIRHVGDLGNIVVDSNLQARINISDSVISLHGENSIVNRTLVVHVGEDDLGKGPPPDSIKTGNSGYRIGCCIITLDQQPMTTLAPTQPTTAGATSVGPLTGILLSCLAALQLLVKSIQL